jgi:phosphocarrier protein
MIEKTVTIKNKMGLHARPAALLVQTASRFKSKIKILRGDQEVDGKSIMGLMTLAASAGSTLKIVADGADEADAISAIEGVIQNGFGEE